MTALNTLSDDELKALYQKAQAPADPLAGMSDEELKAAYNRTQPDQTSWYERGFRGARDVVEGLGQVGARMAMPGVVNQSKLATLAPKVDAEVKASGADYDARRGENRDDFDWMRTGGNIAASIPLAAVVPPGTGMAAQIGSGMLAGGLTGAAQPVTQDQENFWAQKGAQTAAGAGMGGLTSAASNVIGRAINPSLTPDVQAMKAAGVTLTPGQAANGFAQAAETKAANIPFVGDIVRAGQSRSLGDYNVATVNKVLEPLGVTVPKGTQAGNEAIAVAKKAIGDAFDDAYSRLSARPTPEFVQNIAAIGSDVPESFAKEFGKRVTSQFGKFTPDEEISGRALSQTKKYFEGLAQKYARDPGAEQQMLGEAYTRVAGAIDDMMTAAHPAEKGLQAAKAAYAGFLRVQDAAARNMESGVFSPAQLLASVKKYGASGSGSGNAMLQDWGQMGARVLGNNAPVESSMTKMVGGVGMLGAPFFLSQPGVAAGGLAAAGMYSPTGQRLMMNAITNRGDGMRAKAIADALKNATPYASGAAGALTQR